MRNENRSTEGPFSKGGIDSDFFAQHMFRPTIAAAQLTTTQRRKEVGTAVTKLNLFKSDSLKSVTPLRPLASCATTCRFCSNYCMHN